MSRRRGEFEHRTSIFEGAFRAWSHLGGIEPLDLENKPVTDLDPLNFPLLNDPRLANHKGKGKKNDIGDDFNDEGGITSGEPPPLSSSDAPVKSSDSKQRLDYPYEPLPRSGLAHPFVQAILSPWLGPDADQDAIQLGLTTLRTWWQHRRKGESGSAVVALGTDKMKGVVEGYTRHFFNLAHCLIANDNEQPPRSLHGKMRDLEKSRNKKGKKRIRDDESIKVAAMAFQSGFGPGITTGQQQGNNDVMLGQMGGEMNNNDATSNLSPLERLQAAQRRQLTEAGGVHTSLGGGGTGMDGGLPDPSNAASAQPIEMKGKCIPGKVDLPGLVQQVSSAATQLAHRGISGSSKLSQINNTVDPSKYGDPNVTPVVVVSPNPNNTGMMDIQLCMTIDGITCAHCVKIVETVLIGCQGSRSPIDGIVDAAADMELSMVLIKIDDVGECRRIAQEASRNLSMVGYTAMARSVTVSSGLTLQDMYRVMEGTIPSLAPMVGFQWSYGCGCPDNNVLRQDCPRHSQMGSHITEVFDKTEQLIAQFSTGCNKRTGMPCTAGVHCFCQSGANGVATAVSNAELQQQVQSADNVYQELNKTVERMDSSGYKSYQQPIQGSGAPNGGGEGNENGGGTFQRRGRTSMRMSGLGGRMSIGGMGGIGRHYSLTSETQFGRAMSGLSALSFDWENMDDFDVNVDHSAGINNDIINGQQQAAQGGGNCGQDNGAGGYGQQQPLGGGRTRTARRSSLRRNIPMNPSEGGTAFNVSFNM